MITPDIFKIQFFAQKCFSTSIDASVPLQDVDQRSPLLAVLSSGLQLGGHLEHGGQPGGGEVRHGAGDVDIEDLGLQLHPAGPPTDCHHSHAS